MNRCPYKDNGYWYYTRFEEGKQYPVICRKKETLEAPEEIMLDQNIDGRRVSVLRHWPPRGKRQ